MWVIPGGKQIQPVQHAADRRAAGRQRVALTGPAGDQEIGLVEALQEAEAGPPGHGLAIGVGPAEDILRPPRGCRKIS